MKIVLDDGAIMPTRAYDTDAGLDLYAPCDVDVSAHGYAFVDTGVHIQLPENSVGMIKSKSGLNTVFNLTTEGVVDQSYTGSIGVKIYNHGGYPYHFCKGNKISQLVIMPILLPELELTNSLESTDRGNNGFGSTGK